MSFKDRKHLAPFLFYTIVTFVLGVAAATSEARSSGSILLLVVAGFLSWGLVEYVLHRFIFHYEAQSERARTLLYAMHLAHHDDPRSQERLFASLTMSVPIAAGYCLLVWALVGNWHAMVYVFIGLVAGYFSYEALHYQAHHGAPRWRLFKYLKKYHLLHHHQTPELRFGVTSPAFDYLFGTFRPVSWKRAALGRKAARSK